MSGNKTHPIYFPILALLIPLVVYLLTITRDVTYGDSAEFAIQAYQLGVTHPPGYPVHSFLGRLLIFILPEPIIATNLLSVICTSTTAFLLYYFQWRLTSNPYASLLSSLIFAFSPLIWEMAVKTEIYNVNVFFLTLSLLLMLLWHQSQKRSYLYLSSIIFGISLGTSLANLLLLPAFGYFIFQFKKAKIAQVIRYFMITGCTGGLVLSWVVYRSMTLPPLGTTHIPNNVVNAIKYFSASQYGSLALSSLSLFIHRIIEHSYRVSSNLYGFGILLGIFGLFSLFRQQRPIAITLAMIAVFNFGYFNYYRDLDYYTMVTPTYMVFSLWIGYGFHSLDTLKNVRASVALKAITITIFIVFSIFQFNQFLAKSKSTQITEFSLSSLAMFPRDAVVIANFGWFTPLLYYQKIHDIRPDITLIEHEQNVRHYEFGTINGFRDYIHEVINTRPVVIDYIDGDLINQYRTIEIDDSWHQIFPP